MICKDFENWIRTKDIYPDPLNEAGTFESHRSRCPSCEGIYLLDQTLEQTIQEALRPVELPDGLIDQVDISVDHEIQSVESTSFFNRKHLAAGIALLICLISLFAYTRPFQYPNLNELGLSAVTSHLQANTAMTFEAKDLETALPVLSKELQFKVTLPRLSEDEFILLGGRLCVLGKCKIAYLFYEYQDKICSLFVLDNQHLDFELAEGSRFNNRIKGFETHIWKENGQVYAMVF